MKMVDCIDDPKFRREFVAHEIEGLKDVIVRNDSVDYHNDAKISILKEILEKVELTKNEEGVVEEHLGVLDKLKGDTVIQNDRLKIMIDIYDRFKKRVLENNLKLT